jgi:hypothetical protein
MLAAIQSSKIFYNRRKPKSRKLLDTIQKSEILSAKSQNEKK